MALKPTKCCAQHFVGYKALFQEGPVELACLAYVRRKFFDLHAASSSPVAEQALQRIARLYAIEQQGAGLKQPRRLALRQELAMPALAELHAWLLARQRTPAAGSGTAKAIEHAIKRWSATPAPSARAGAPPSRACSPPPNSTGSIPPAGSRTRSNNCPLAPTAGSIPCCRLRTLLSFDRWR